MQMGKFSLAKDEIEEAHKLDPLSPIISANTGLYSYYEHNYDDAIAKYKTTLQSDPDFWVARHYLALAYVQKGMHEQLESLSKKRYVSPLYFAIVYAGLKDNDNAIEYLNKAFDARHPGLVLIRIEPMFDGLRSDERFKTLIQRFEPIP
jgi:tetratricopeptide (TPR) repeat protein